MLGIKALMWEPDLNLPVSPLQEWAFEIYKPMNRHQQSSLSEINILVDHIGKFMSRISRFQQPIRRNFNR